MPDTKINPTDFWLYYAAMGDIEDFEGDVEDFMRRLKRFFHNFIQTGKMLKIFAFDQTRNQTNDG